MRPLCTIAICKEPGTRPVLLVMQSAKRIITHEAQYCPSHLDWQAENMPLHILIMVRDA